MEGRKQTDISHKMGNVSFMAKYTRIYRYVVVVVIGRILKQARTLFQTAKALENYQYIIRGDEITLSICMLLKCDDQTQF